MLFLSQIVLHAWSGKQSSSCSSATFCHIPFFLLDPGGVNNHERLKEFIKPTINIHVLRMHVRFSTGIQAIICIRRHIQQFSPRGDYSNIEAHLTRSNCAVIRWLMSSAIWKRRKWNISGKCGRNQRVDIVTRILVRTRLRLRRDRYRLRNVW